MASLIAKAATDGLLPLTIGTLTLSAAPVTTITSISPYPGKEKASSAALKKLGLAWPAPDRAITKGDATIIWSGRAQAFLFGATPDGLEASAALVDISDGWVGITLAGPLAHEALARLVPLDLSPAAFPVGATARAGLGHMMGLFHRSAAEAITIHVFRSMVVTAVHEIEGTMKSLAARASA